MSQNGSGIVLPFLPHLQFGLFNDANTEELRSLRAISRICLFDAEQVLPTCRSGKEGFYYIHQGHVRMTMHPVGQEKTLRIIGPDDLAGFGRWQAPVSYDLIAGSSLTTSFFLKDEFFKVQALSPAINRVVMRWILQQVEFQEAQATHLIGSAEDVNNAI